MPVYLPTIPYSLRNRRNPPHPRYFPVETFCLSTLHMWATMTLLATRTLRYPNFRYLNFRYANFRYPNFRYPNFRYLNFRYPNFGYPNFGYPNFGYPNFG